MKVGFFLREGGSFHEAQILETAQHGEELGFYACWLTEHHVKPDRYWPKPLVEGAAIAAVTDTLELCTTVLLLPLHHPLEVAEEAAMVDQISGGRLNLGVSYGYIPSEFDAYDVPRGERSGRLVEGLKLLDRFLSTDDTFSLDGRYWQYEDWEPTPRTMQNPRPPLWLGGWGDRTLKRSITFADTWVPGGSGDLDAIASRQEKIREFADEEGIDFDGLDKPLHRELIVAETHEEAMEMAKEHLHPVYMFDYGSEDWSHNIVSKDLAEDFEALAEERFLVGSPTEIVEQVEHMQERFEMDHLGIRFTFPKMTQEEIRSQMELLGDEVIPEL